MGENMDNEKKICTEDILQQGEQVLWEGAPEAKVYLELVDILMIPFSIYWCVFIVVWEVLTIKAGTILFCIVGIPFVLVGLYLLAGRFFINARRLRACRYLATDWRLIFISARGLDFISYDRISRLKKRERKDGVGTIFFGPFLAYFQTYVFQADAYLGEAWKVKALENIRDVDRVYHLIVRKTAEKTGEA